MSTDERVKPGERVPDAVGLGDVPDAAGSDLPTEDPTAHPRRRVLRRGLLSPGVLGLVRGPARLGVLGLVLARAVGGGLWFLTDRYAGNIDRVTDVFGGLDDETRPAPSTPEQAAAAVPVTFLLVGSDTRTAPEPGELPDGRSDAI